MTTDQFGGGRAADGRDAREDARARCVRCIAARRDPGRDRLHRRDRRRRADDARPRRVGLLGVDRRRRARCRRSLDLDRRRRRDDGEPVGGVPRRATLPEISYSEASELAYYGAKVLHYKTILPAFRQRIPVRILNSFNPTHPGTRVSVEGDPSVPGVKAVTSIRGVSLIAISGTGMQGIPGIVAKAFDVVAEQQSNVLMISQASSENNICFVISAAEAPRRGARRCAAARDRADARPHRGDRRAAGGGRRGGRRPHARHARHRRDRVRRAGRRADQRHRDLAGLVRAEHLAGRGGVGCDAGGSSAAPGVSPRARQRVASSSRPVTELMPVRDVIIVGAGPSGLATAIAAKQQGLDYVDRRERRAGQFDLQLSDAHGVLHHAGAARDRRPAAGHAVRQADAARGAALLPPRRGHLRPPDLVSRRRSSRSSASDDGVVRGDARRIGA